MAYGAAKTNEPIREGMLATLGPVFDTLIVCTCTAIVILLCGHWQQPGELSGITLTANAFHGEMGGLGLVLLAFVALILSTTTMFTGWYYGAKCFGFLVGAQWQPYFRWFFVLAVMFGDCEHRCGLQSDLGELRADGNPDDQLYCAGPESGRSKPRLFRGALREDLSTELSRNLRVAGWQLEDQ